MGSRFFAAFAAISLVICMLTTALWVRSYFILDAMDWSTSHGRAGFSTTQGHIAYGAVSLTPAYRGKVIHGFSYRSTAVGYGFSLSIMRPWWTSWTGFALARVRQPSFSAWDFRVPFWLPLLLSAIAPLLWYRRRHRYPPGTCQQCGYDLRASPNRCPECGAIWHAPANLS